MSVIESYNELKMKDSYEAFVEEWKLEFDIFSLNFGAHTYDFGTFVTLRADSISCVTH